MAKCVPTDAIDRINDATDALEGMVLILSEVPRDGGFSSARTIEPILRLISDRLVEGRNGIDPH